jgi:hypothetical protein
MALSSNIISDPVYRGIDRTGYGARRGRAPAPRSVRSMATEAPESVPEWQPQYEAQIAPQVEPQYQTDRTMQPPGEDSYYPPPNYQPPAPPAAPAYDAGGPQTYHPDLTTTDPYERFTQDRTSWYDRGNRIDSDLQGETVYRRGEEQRYGGMMDRAAQDLYETPGYTPQEQAGIMREGESYNLLNEDYSSNFLTPGEMEEIRGDPYRSERYYNPGDLDRRNNETAGYVYDSLNQTEGALTDNVAHTRAGVNAAIDPSKLGLSQEYRGNQDAVLNTTAGEVYGAIDPSRLRMDAEYARQAGMSDDEVETTVQAAERNIGNRYRSAVGDLERSAAESGNASPLAIAAARARLERQSAVDAADAGTDAYLAARQAQRDAATGVEGTRLGAEQTYSGLRSGAAMDLGGMASGAVSERERLRQGSEQDISSRQMEGALQTGGMAQDAITYAGNSRTSNLQQIGDRGQQTGQWSQGTGIDMAGRNEQAASDRGGYIATNRQGVNQGNQAARFDRGFAVNEAQSGRTQTVGDARRQGQQTYLGWASDQTGRNTEAGTTARGQRIDNFGTQAGAVNDATRGNATYDLGRRGQSFGTNFKTSLGSTLGKTLGDPVGLYKKAKQ